MFARSCQDGDIKVPKRHRQCVIESVRMASLQKHMRSCSSHFKVAIINIFKVSVDE